MKREVDKAAVSEEVLEQQRDDNPAGEHRKIEQNAEEWLGGASLLEQQGRVKKISGLAVASSDPAGKEKENVRWKIAS